MSVFSKSLNRSLGRRAGNGPAYPLRRQLSVEAQENLCAPLLLLMEWQVPARRRQEIKKAKTRVMPSSHLNDPEYWRDRAKKVRAMAEDMADPVYKQKMLDIAANYEYLAKRAEDRRAGKAPKP